MTTPPLAGLRVLDLSRILAGPYCTQMLADLGADVIKVEPPEGDDTRQFGPPFVAGESTYFLAINRGKRSLCLDLKTPGGQDIALELAQWADVVVENFRPGVAERLGVGFARLSAANERLIYGSISGFGQRGQAPFTSMPGYDLVIQGLGGIPSLTGPESGPPYKMGTSVADMVSGLNALAAILAALVQRQQTGRGQHLDVAMLDGQLSLLSFHASSWLNTGTEPRRLGNAHPSICPYETFETADGFINIACGNDAQFRKLCAALGVPELGTDARFATNAARVHTRSALLAVLAPILRQRPVAVWVDVIGQAGVPCGPILDVPTAVQHPQAAARGMIVESKHAACGAVRTMGAPLGFAQSSYATRPPPRLGEHCREVLADVLGYSEARIAAAVGAGAVRDAK